MKFLALGSFMLFAGLACQTNPKQVPEPSEITYEDFQKVLKPSYLSPIANQAASYALLTKPEDKYQKLYKLDHKTQKFSLEYDAGEGIDSLSSNAQGNLWFLSIDKDGDENYQIYRYDPELKKRVKVFGNDGFKATLVDINDSGDTIYFTSNHGNKSLYRLYRLNLTSNASEVLTDDSFSVRWATIHPNESLAILYESRGNNESLLHYIDFKSKKSRVLLAKPNTVYRPSFIREESNKLYFVTDDGLDRMACASIKLEEKNMKYQKTDKTTEGDIFSCDYDEAGNFSYYLESIRGRTTLNFFSGLFKSPLQVEVDPNSTISSVRYSPSMKTIIFKKSSASSPGDYFTTTIAGDKLTTPTQITKLNLSKLKAEDFTTSFDVDYKSFDGLDIHGILYGKKSWQKSGEKRPIILWPHGGPDHFEGHRFVGIFQYWNTKGYWVFAPNFRGSTGYGKKFETLNDRDWGGGHIKDLIWGKKHLAAKPYIDADRFYISGGSFGGFSVLSAITQYPKEFRAAVALVAIANLTTFMDSIPKDPSWQAEFIGEVGDPVKDKKLYRERSPYFYADQISIPLKIYQAENDVRTVKAEMDNFVEQMKKANKPVDYIVLKGVGHGIANPEYRKKIAEETIEFFEKN